jgi:DinB superfamily
MTQGDLLRQHLISFLESGDAHVSFKDAVAGVPSEFQGVRPASLPYSVWELVEHIRRAQYDILEFSRNPKYVQPKFPDNYWPETASPPAPDSWSNSIERVLADRNELITFISDPALDLFSQVPSGNGQTYLREVLLVADHNSYHVGELVAVRRALGIWK